MDIFFTYKRFVLLAGKAARSLARIAGLTPQRAEVLMLLEREDMVLRELAIRLCVCPSVASRIGTALEDLGLLVKRVLAHDRRFRSFHITERGLAALSQLYDGWLAAGTGETTQLSGEGVLYEMLAPVAPKLAIGPISDDPQNELLRAAYLTVRATNYLREWMA